jgi:hypothetical protein
MKSSAGAKIGPVVKAIKLSMALQSGLVYLSIYPKWRAVLLKISLMPKLSSFQWHCSQRI